MIEEKEENNSGKRIILILLALFLLGSLGFNVFQYINKDKIKAEEQKMEKELVSSQNLRNDLQAELDRVKAELEEYKGKSKNVDALILQKENELSQKAARIEVLLKDNKISYNKYLRVKDEMQEWKYNAEKYLTQVQDLTAQNLKLQKENEELSDELVEGKKKMNDLTDVNTELNNKVALGAQLKIESISVSGVKVKSSGSERETNKASQVQKLKICFYLPENHIADNGNRDIFIKVTDPTGQPVSKDMAGGGSFTIGNKPAKYTAKQSIFYDNEPKNFCIYWNQASEANLQDGIYTIELYTDGYKMGEKNFTLK